jgi:integrase
VPGRSTSALLRWRANIANGSETYAAVSDRRLRAFCRDVKVEPADLATLEAKVLRELLEDYLDGERKKDHSGDYIRTTLKAIRSWLVYNGTESAYPRGLKVPNSRRHPVIEAETTPTTDELRRILLAGSPSERLAVGFVAFAGLRIQVLGNFLGDDGLVVSDLPELKVEGKRVSFTKIPAMVRVRAANSKAGHEFFSFIGEEGCRYVKESLEERIRKGERIGPTTDLVSPERAHKRFLTSINVGDRIRKPMRAAGVKARPYSLRSYYNQKCLEAQSAAGVPDRFIEFWMGHRGDVSQVHYGAGKPHLSETLVEQMRAAYAKCLPFLETSLGSRPRDTGTEFRKALLDFVGVAEKDLPKYLAASNEELREVLRDKLLGKTAPGGSSAVGPHQTVVAMSEAEGLIAGGGFEYVAQLGSDRVVLRPSEQ